MTATQLTIQVPEFGAVCGRWQAHPGRAPRRHHHPHAVAGGLNDALAELDLLQQTVAGLKGRATLELIDATDHAFNVPAKTGRNDAEALATALQTTVHWIAAIA